MGVVRTHWLQVFGIEERHLVFGVRVVTNPRTPEKRQLVSPHHLALLRRLCDIQLQRDAQLLQFVLDILAQIRILRRHGERDFRVISGNPLPFG